MDEFNPRKWILILGLLCGGGWYLRTQRHWGLTQSLAYAKSHTASAVAAPTQYYGGNYYYMASRWEDAARAYEDLIQLHPDSPYASEATFRLGNCYSEQRKWGPARDAYQRHLDDPRGRHHAAAGNKLEAIRFK